MRRGSTCSRRRSSVGRQGKEAAGTDTDQRELKVTLLAEKSYTRAELEALDQQHKQLKAEHDQLVRVIPSTRKSIDRRRGTLNAFSSKWSPTIKLRCWSTASVLEKLCMGGDAFEHKELRATNETEIRKVAERVINLVTAPATREYEKRIAECSQRPRAGDSRACR